MKRFLLLSCGIWFLSILCSYAQMPRQDVIWAKTTTNNIVLDGKLDEADWAQAESLKIVYGKQGLLPTSGWRAEFQPEAIKDSINATVKFLVKGQYLYLGFIIPDSSIGGTKDWARFDGILMSIKNRKSVNRPTDALEFSYLFWRPELADGVAPKPGDPPRILGAYGNYNDTSRTDAQREVYDVASVIDGISNDALPDKGWTVEARFNLDSLGYKPTQPDGDIVEFNVSIWDCDNLFSGHAETISTARASIQNAWNDNGQNVLRIYTKPDITINTTSLPVIPPDVVLGDGSNLPEPTIDGDLTEDVWKYAYSFNIVWNDSIVRSGYPGVGPWRSGQYQPELSGNPRPPVLDPMNANIKMFYRGTKLFLSADVQDQVVTGTAVYDALDGIRFLIMDRIAKNIEQVPITRSLFVSFGPDGKKNATDYLPTLIDTGAVQYELKLKPNTTVNNNTDIDEGYTIEMSVDLTKLGYPADLGDRILFMGVDAFDGDVFDDPLKNYGTRTWWFREHEGGPSLAWIYMDPNKILAVNDNSASIIPSSIVLKGNYPNPFNPSTKLSYTLPQSGNVQILIYNSLGQKVYSENQINKPAGSNEFLFNAENISSGVYFYKIILNAQNKSFESAAGKMVLMK